MLIHEVRGRKYVLVGRKASAAGCCEILYMPVAVYRQLRGGGRLDVAEATDAHDVGDWHGPYLWPAVLTFGVYSAFMLHTCIDWILEADQVRRKAGVFCRREKFLILLPPQGCRFDERQMQLDSAGTRGLFTAPRSRVSVGFSLGGSGQIVGMFPTNDVVAFLFGCLYKCLGVDDEQADGSVGTDGSAGLDGTDGSAEPGRVGHGVAHA